MSLGDKKTPDGVFLLYFMIASMAINAFYNRGQYVRN